MKKILWISCFWVLGSEAQKLQTLEFSIGGNEPSIAINPMNNAQVVLAFNNFSVFKSSDTGKTFKRVNVTSRYGFYGDPVLYWGFGQNAYLAHLAQNKKYYWPGSFDRMVFQKIKFSKNRVRKSTGIGYNSRKSDMIFSEPGYDDQPSERQAPHKMQDKPWFTVNRNPNDRHFGRIHMSWTEFDSYGSKKPGDSSRIRYAWSDNKGKSFSRPITISQRSGDAKDGDSTLEGATLCVDRAGKTYCVWSGLNQLWFTSSSDGGLHWEKPVVMGAHENGWNMEPGGIMRANGMPFLVSLNKKLLLVWAARHNGGSSIFYRFYDTDSKSWGEPLSIWIAEPGNVFMPQVCVKEGKAFIAFYSSTEIDPESSTYELKIYTAMLDETHPEAKVTARFLSGSAFRSEGKPFLGDYIGICALNQSATDEVLLAYTMLVGNKDTYIALARIKF